MGSSTIWPKVTPGTRAGTFLALAILLGQPLGAPGLQAQADGRWRLIISPGPTTEINGDLRLTESDDKIFGTLLLETSDSAPNEVTGTVPDADGRFEFKVESSARRFVGRILGDQMFGTVFRGAVSDGIGWLAERVDTATYVLRPVQDRNYGGVSCTMRWLIWLTPLWVVCLLPAADAMSTNRWWRIFAMGLLVVSVVSATFPASNPWQHSWIYQYCQALGWLPGA